MLRSQILFVCVCRLGVCAGKKTGTLKYPSPSHLLQSLNGFSGRWELAPDRGGGVCCWRHRGIRVQVQVVVELFYSCLCSASQGHLNWSCLMKTCEKATMKTCYRTTFFRFMSGFLSFPSSTHVPLYHRDISKACSVPDPYLRPVLHISTTKT